ncbi:MAG TPA: slipin family protein [Leptospiraceae bacterium]|nr:slipin family protein [Leptospiraceae bacterium]HMW07067.1 slipin family protein [Leptospiraceae bacterium]HMY33740.1 slipin family protein [Leptospiraceae bacterium]HMZ66232.1 slipin family protein [Leptospiraceae bacterium]HNA07799.1 slipin family protein [Leptospiraceae bacterium]
MFTTIRNDERGLLFKDGNYIKTLKPGKYLLAASLGHTLIRMDVNKAFVTEKNLNLFLKDQSLVEELSIVEVNEFEICLHYEDNLLANVLKPGRYAFWNILKKHEFKLIDTRNPIPNQEFNQSLFTNIKLNGFYYAFQVENHEAGLLYFNGVFQSILKPGKYYFWAGVITANVIKIDLRQQQLDINGQELMTEDKITLRLNFTSQYKITNPLKVMEIKNYQEQVYILLQLSLREYVGALKLDELLQKKQEIADFVLTKLKEKSNDFGIEFVFAGLKDIILPGEIKDILNLVLIAEKKAQANIITRREETASTRSLLNTAKLMEENPTLYRLKELEYIEKISEKVNSISLSSSSGILEQLASIVNIKK